MNKKTYSYSETEAFEADEVLASQISGRHLSNHIVKNFNLLLEVLHVCKNKPN